MLELLEPGLYTMNVGNLLPGERAKITFSYAMLYRWSGDSVRFFLPTTVAPGAAFPLSITWRNKGVAQMWFPCSVALALLDSQGKCVSRTWLADSNPGACPGQQARTETLKAMFDAVPAGGPSPFTLQLSTPCPAPTKS